MTRGRQPRLRHHLTVAALAILAGAALVVGALGIAESMRSGDAPGGPVDMRGEPVELDPSVTPIPASASRAVATGHGRLEVPSVDLDVPLGALDAVDGVITPPGFTSAYVVRNLGVPLSRSSRGTTFVVMHSLRGGGVAPGNALVDAASGSARVRAGDPVRADGTTYTVASSRLVARDRIAADADVWADTPDRLVLITCLLTADGSPSSHNLVVTAVRRGP